MTINKKIEKPVIFISNFHPFTTRNIFNSGVLEILSRSAKKVVAFVPQQKEEYMKNLYEKGNIIIHGVNAAEAISRTEFLFFRFSEVLINTQTKRDHQLKYLVLSNNPLRHIKYYFAIFIIMVLGRLFWVKKLFRFLDNVLIHPTQFTSYFKKYKPDIVFATDIFAPTDIRLLKEGRSLGVRSVGLVRSWDNTTSKGLLRIIPDRIIVQNETMKNEVASIHAVSREIISVVGVPQFEFYLRFKPADREVFFASLGLDPRKRTIAFSPAGNKFIDTDWQFCAILKRLHGSGKIPADIQFIILLHPFNTSDLSKFRPTSNFIIDKPKLGYQTDQKKENEMTEETAYHFANVLYHCDLLLNIVSSTVVDASIFNKPTIMLAFNGWEKKVPYLRSVEKVQKQEWLRILFDNGVAPKARNVEELADLINEHLANPDKLKVQRQQLVNEHCYNLDGHAAERIAGVVLSKI